MVRQVACRLMLVWVLALAGPGCGDGRGPGGAKSGPLKEVTTKAGVRMVLVPGGEFVMGDENGADDEKPVHKVKVDDFWMDKCEVSQQSYQALMGRNPSKRKGDGNPVEQVSWYDAIRYCNMRSMKEGLSPCYDLKTGRCDFRAGGYRLPTEAEWEYACRAGTTTRYSFGENAGRLGEYGWFRGNSEDTVHAVGQKKPNGWGLHDVHGGVAEWCNDWYAKGYEAGAGENPRGPESGERRVLRGGSWRSPADGCRSAARQAETPAFADVCFNADLYGFRCVRRAEEAGAR